MTRLQWADLPGEARAQIEARFGPADGAVSAGPGLTPGVAAHLTTERGIFLKGIPLRSPARHHYERELAVNTVLPGGVPAPRLLWSGRAAGWLLLVFERILDARQADLSPESPDVDAVLDAVTCLGEVLAACPWPDAPGVDEKFDVMRRRAQAELGGRYAEALYALDLREFGGSALLHADLHEGNLLVTHHGRVHVVDWSLACRGPAWMDLALLVPRLIAAGHTPAQAEALAATVPAWKAAPPAAVTALAAVRAGFAAHMARHGPGHLRARRERTAAACRAWLAYRT